jgi:hypothetical protein
MGLKAKHPARHTDAAQCLAPGNGIQLGASLQRQSFWRAGALANGSPNAFLKIYHAAKINLLAC